MFTVFSNTMRLPFREHFNPIIKILILSDFIVWTGISLVTPILSVFFVEQVEGMSIVDIGIGVFITLFIAGILEIYVGHFLDKTRGDKDEIYFLIIGNVIISVYYAILAFLPSRITFYIYCILNAFSQAMVYPAWRKLFTKFVDKGKEGLQWSIYDTIMNMGIGIASAIGGIIVETLVGFTTLFLIISIITLVGSLVPCYLFFNLKRKYLHPETEN